MSQPSVAEFFSNRKHVAVDDVGQIKSKTINQADQATASTSVTARTPSQQDDDISVIKAAGIRTRSGRTIKRIGPQQSELIELFPQKVSKIEKHVKQKKIVQFIKKGPLSPRKKSTTPAKQQLQQEQTLIDTKLDNVFASKNNATNIQRGMKTPTKQIMKDMAHHPKHQQQELNSLVKKELSFDEVKSKISRSAKLQELKASLSRIQELEKARKEQEERNRKLREAVPASAKQTPVVQLKEFDTIELEILTSPSKKFKTPTKLLPATPDKNELMSPRHTDVSKRVLFSPSKNGSPSKMIVPPAYQRYLSLAETSRAGQLAMPYKYRYLLEIFKGLDSVCAMFHNRKECITFKKLQPAVQRMLRKNFTETHLAQIKRIYPEAFIFSQMKMRNYGSESKADYYQLVISPNVEELSLEKQNMHCIDEDDVLSTAQAKAMNPHVMTERTKRFQSLLLNCVKNEHDKFLKSLDPPLSIPQDKVTRWHPDFDLDNCPNIECAPLPRPPNVEKYSSARDILSTARNLFNCVTPMERAMERYEAKLKAERNVSIEQNQTITNVENKTAIKEEIKTLSPLNAKGTAVTTVPVTTSAADITSNLLKGLPQSLIDKIRAKQAAKALDAMTRRPSQDEETTKYARLPELAKYVRNIFITERKGVLSLEVVVKKIENSFRANLSPQEIEIHLKLMAKVIPAWVSFHEVRKTMYLKIAKDMDLKVIVEQLENAANAKSKLGNC